MTRRTDIVVTTVLEPAWLPGYLANLRAHGHAEAVTLRIICDRKTPPSVYQAARDAQRAGFAVDCPTLDEQEAYLRSIAAPDGFIPWNTDNRRNIGYLRAWQHGADVIVSIDDDNYCRDGEDFVAAHGVVGSAVGALPDVRESGAAPWFNICDLLEIDAGTTVYPRGFPYFARRPDSTAAPREMPAATRQRRVALNAGLWLDEPDIDALTRLAVGPRATAARRQAAVVLSPESWSPINVQNTGLIRDALPAYYYVRMGFSLQGLKIDRFGDILSGYFVQKCAKHLGDAIRLGSPVVDHRRTRHNPFVDLYQELAGIVLIEDLLPWLREVQLAGSTYAETYAGLADALAAQAPRFKGFVWDDGGREFLAETAASMKRWLDLL